jgi:hypothetical protein
LIPAADSVFSRRFLDAGKAMDGSGEPDSPRNQRNQSTMKIAIVLLLVLGASVPKNLAAAEAQPGSPAASDPGWPRQKTTDQGSLVYYQPQVDDWKDFKQLDFRMAFSLTPKGQKEVVGVLSLQAQTAVDVDQHDVVLTDFKITQVRFPSLDPEKTAQLEQLVRGFLPQGYVVAMSLDRLVASVNKPNAAPTVKVQNDPPPIFVSYTPAILLQIDGKPTRAEIVNTDLGFVVNSNFPLFFQTDAAKDYYLYTGAQWLKSASMEGPWAPSPKLPADFSNVAHDPKWAQMKEPILSPSAKEKPPTIFYSNKPAEVILFEGQPAYANIAGTQLSFATNTGADLFVYAPTKEYFYLAAGRWFKSAELQGPWTYATPDLPPDFAKIPENSPAARVLVSVPGTAEAQDAVLLAQIPTTAVVQPKAAEQVKVSYSGNPEFKPIEGTSLEYAVNTPDKIIKDGDVYYLCLQGVWFTSPNATGAWTTASSVPKEIYTIPPSSPVYNVTYVTQSTTPDGTIQASYTAGYLGTFIAGAAVGAILASGTGYYYPPYYGYPVGGYPVYHPYPCTYGVGSYYNPYTGAYGVGHGVYGPYRGAAAGAAYNPYTGTYARGATAYGPYGSQSVARAYNPYTGTSAATHQGSNAYSSWGQSVVSNGNKSAYTQHYSNANGTVATAQGSKGGAAAGVSTKYGNTGVAKNSSGDMYAAHDGNVYKNTGNGWKSYDNGNWNSINSSKNAQAQRQNLENSGANQAGAEQHARNSQRTYQSAQTHRSGVSDVDRDFENRQRGSFQSQRFDSFQRGGGGWGDRERGGFGRRR